MNEPAIREYLLREVFAKPSKIANDLGLRLFEVTTITSNNQVFYYDQNGYVALRPRTKYNAPTE
jgi:hypothetical protein